MEVHKHPHHVIHKKKWVEYLLEFFMLFLAVFLGFLAENQRENNVEHNREKQYIQSFVEDLDADNDYLQETLISFNNKKKIADSLIMLLGSATKNEGINDIYFYFRNIVRYRPFNVNDRTIVQLRNAGGMRLILNKSVSDSMVSYYRDVDNIKYLDGLLIERISELSNTTDKLLDGIDYGKLTDTTNNVILRIKEPMKLRNTDDETINTAIISVQRIKNISILIKLAVIKLKEKANITRHFILKQYHLEMSDE
ncbi:MAG: hypothetical protein H0W62_15155 [Chitinophagales bacterium]|nr:hypothetical protein [Chitinophagales bacterium]